MKKWMEMDENGGVIVGAMPPSNIQPSNEILRLIASIDEFKGEWRAVESIKPERLQSLRRVATIESIGSSTRIEGAKLSDREVEPLLRGLQTESFRSRDEQEVAGYAYVMETIHASWQEMPVTEGIVLQLHRDLLGYSTKDKRQRGQWNGLSAPHAEIRAEVMLDRDGMGMAGGEI